VLRRRSGCSRIFGEPVGFSNLGKGDMKKLVRYGFVIAAFAGALVFSLAAGAQQKQQGTAGQRQAYDPGREVSLQGVVLAFTENALRPPLGAHVSVQTASGVMDVHLGDARLLQANQFSLAVGDNVRIVGENISSGGATHFFARVIQKGGGQKGSQSVTLRSTRGFPLRATAKSGNAQAGAL
jgi:hypothetical protein